MSREDERDGAADIVEEQARTDAKRRKVKVQSRQVTKYVDLPCLVVVLLFSLLVGDLAIWRFVFCRALVQRQRNVWRQRFSHSSKVRQRTLFRFFFFEQKLITIRLFFAEHFYGDRVNRVDERTLSRRRGPMPLFNIEKK